MFKLFIFYIAAFILLAASYHTLIAQNLFCDRPDIPTDKLISLTPSSEGVQVPMNSFAQERSFFATQRSPQTPRAITKLRWEQPRFGLKTLFLEQRRLDEGEIFDHFSLLHRRFHLCSEPNEALRDVPSYPPEQRRAGSFTSSDSVQIEWVKHYASGLAPALDHATAVAVDVSGNV